MEVGGMLGLNGGEGGTGFSTQNGTSAQQLGTAYTGAQNAMGGQNALLQALQAQNGLGNQSQVYNQYQGIANGTGPNPAQAMLNQATGQNVANQAALMAGQRGAGSNVGLMARQVAQQGANTQQQAAGQAATMQAQQSLNALGQAGGMANTMAANQIGQQNANVAAQQNEQGVLQGANTGYNSIQGQLANTRMGQQGQVLGGLMQGAAQGAAMMADGGQVDGAAFGPQSMFGQALSAPQQASVPTFSSDSGQDLKKGIGSMMKGKGGGGGPMAGASQIGGSGSGGMMAGAGESAAPMAMMAASKGGNVGDQLKGGGHVPGKASAKGDSYKNDTVKALLSPGEVVIPRSVMNSKDPARGAAEFVASVMAKKGKR